MLPKKGGWVAALGRRALRIAENTLALTGTLTGAVSSVWAPGAAAAAHVRAVALAQIVYTGVHAVTLISLIGLLMGTTIIIQTNILAPGAGGELLGLILVAVVIRELAPLTTAIIIAGRSGTAMATELGNMQVNSEIAALASLGVDPYRYVVWPRVVGSVVSVLSLTIYFAAVAVGGGYVVSLFIAAPSFNSIQAGFDAALEPIDLPFFFIKGGGLGLIVGWLSCHFGLQVKSSATEVPQQASRAVVMAIIGCVAFNTGVTLGFYYLVDPPIPHGPL